jgi:type IV pili sensor histidine kinase/response regulator
MFSPSKPKSGFDPAWLMFAAGILFTGCSFIPTSEKPITENVPEAEAHLRSQPAKKPETPDLKHVRYDRYTVMSTSPKPDQIDLLAQIIDIRIPESLTPSVQDAMTHALRRSGYQLCPATDEVQQLYAHALPASHYQLGPMALRDALQVLAGPPWELEIDELARSICFGMRPDFHRSLVGVTVQGGER